MQRHHEPTGFWLSTADTRFTGAHRKFDSVAARCDTTSSHFPRCYTRLSSAKPRGRSHRHFVSNNTSLSLATAAPRNNHVEMVQSGHALARRHQIRIWIPLWRCRSISRAALFPRRYRIPFSAVPHHPRAARNVRDSLDSPSYVLGRWWSPAA